MATVAYAALAAATDRPIYVGRDRHIDPAQQPIRRLRASSYRTLATVGDQPVFDRHRGMRVTLPARVLPVPVLARGLLNGTAAPCPPTRVKDGPAHTARRAVPWA
jgi:hypothetical protein